MSNTDNILQSRIDSLYKKGKIPKNTQKLIDAGIKTFEDILWTYPLRIQVSPQKSSFESIVEGNIFRGSGEIISRRSYPAYGFKGKGRVQLFNIQAVVKDDISGELTTLKWFNTYPNLRKSINELTHINFYGQVTNSKGQLAIVNPKLENDSNAKAFNEPFLIEYPTIAGVAGKFTKAIIDKLPQEAWESIQDPLPQQVIEKNNLISLSKCFKIIHGKLSPEEWSDEKLEQSKNRLIYQEFFSDQLKILTRKKFLKKKVASIFQIKKDDFNKLQSFFPYQLTGAQIRSIEEIKEDLNSGHPMMRMIQGDVGCGKTTVAASAAYFAVNNNKQVAIMAPTETLARQHFKNFKSTFENENITVDLLLGSHKASEKKVIYSDLESGKTQIIIGTHSLFQDKVPYNDLGLVVIDEQHKFGVEQRLKLLAKGDNPHCIIMTATPIPRTLRLTQYGDLDISLIKEMPKGRKGTKTRIVEKETYDKFLSFIKTRISIGEQVYVVAPAIVESETLDIQNVTELREHLSNFYPEKDIQVLHGKLKADEKDSIIEEFKKGSFPILVSTSVIEVGIDVANATVMAIYNPERFGLSSLHQLRGRVGRGEKPGFCFLVSQKQLTPESKERLSILEKTSDGFKIAEEDLKFRGEGDVFGVNQSGQHTNRRYANAFIHSDIFENTLRDIEFLKTEYPEYIDKQTSYLLSDDKITSTI